MKEYIIIILYILYICWLLPRNQRFYSQIAGYFWGGGGGGVIIRQADDERGHESTKIVIRLNWVVYNHASRAPQ